jgi:hypothetical protein
MAKYYYYLHENGELILKLPIVVESDPEYFNSPFVRKVWTIDMGERSTLWRFILEAITLNASIERIRELMGKWAMTIEDSFEYIVRTQDPGETMKSGLEKIIVEIFKITVPEYFEVRLRQWFVDQKAASVVVAEKSDVH